METVAIRVRPDQRDHIEQLKLYPRDTVSDVLDRLLGVYESDGSLEVRTRIIQKLFEPKNAREAQEQR